MDTRTHTGTQTRQTNAHIITKRHARTLKHTHLHNGLSAVCQVCISCCDTAASVNPSSLNPRSPLSNTHRHTQFTLRRYTMITLFFLLSLFPVHLLISLCFWVIGFILFFITPHHYLFSSYFEMWPIIFNFIWQASARPDVAKTFYYWAQRDFAFGQKVGPILIWQ